MKAYERLMRKLVELRSSQNVMVKVASVLTILGLLTGIIKEGVAEGTFLNINPFIIQVLIVGTMCFFRTTAPLREKLASVNAGIGELDTFPPEYLSGIIEEVVLKTIKKEG